MKPRKILVGLILACLFMTPTSDANAIGKYEWWSTSATDSWFKNGIMCYKQDEDTQVGMNFKVSYKLGQSKKFATLGKGVSISGDTQVDAKGNIPTDLSLGVMTACDGGAESVAFISPRTPNIGGSYIIRLEAYNGKGKAIWYDDLKVLAAFTGAEKGSNFFTSPPNIVFTDETYAFLSPSSGVKGYTSEGNPRNACLLLYDIVLKSAKTDVSTTATQLIASAQGGNFAISVRYVIGNAAIPTAIKCAPWIANYLW
jgi:hypothetical protein